MSKTYIKSFLRFHKQVLDLYKVGIDIPLYPLLGQYFLEILVHILTTLFQGGGSKISHLITWDSKIPEQRIAHYLNVPLLNVYIIQSDCVPSTFLVSVEYPPNCLLTQHCMLYTNIMLGLERNGLFFMSLNIKYTLHFFI